MKSNKDIVLLIKDQDPKGLALLYDNYAPALLGIIVRIVKSKGSGEEVLQNTLLKAWDSIDQYNPQRGNFFTWIATIARSKSLDLVRLKSHQRHSELEDLDSATLHPVKVSTDNLDVQNLLTSLNEKHRVILDLIYLQGYTHKETAQSLELPLGTVKTRLRSAINILRDSLDDEKKIFFGSILLLILLTILRWV